MSYNRLRTVSKYSLVVGIILLSVGVFLFMSSDVGEKLGKLVCRAPSEEELETKVEPKEKPAKIEEKVEEEVSPKEAEQAPVEEKEEVVKKPKEKPKKAPAKEEESKPENS